MKLTFIQRIFSLLVASCVLIPSTSVFAESLASPSYTLALSATDEQDNALRFQVDVVHDETLDLFSDMNVRLEKWYYSPDIPVSTGHEDYYTGEIEVLESWNTSEANPYLSDAYVYTPEKPFDVFAVIDEVPAGYSFYGQESGKLGWTYLRVGAQTYSCTIRLKKEKYYDYADFPITGTYTQCIRVVDTFTQEPMLNLDCAVINTDTGAEVYRWNTFDEPIAVVSGLEYRFEDWKMKNTISYIVKVLNMPEGYIMNYMGLKDYEPIFYWGVWYDEGLTEIDTVIELYNTNPDAPQSTMITTTTTDTTTIQSDTETTATTTTTASLLTETTTIQSDSETTATTTTEATTTLQSSAAETTTSSEATTASESETAETTTLSSDTSEAPVSEIVTTTASDLPQTGNNNPARLLAVLSALITAGAGAALLALRRKDTL